MQNYCIMLIFAKVFLVVFISEIVESEIAICDKENLDLSVSESTNLTALFTNALKYFTDLNHKYDSKVHAIAEDINALKNLFHSSDTQSASGIQRVPTAKAYATVTQVTPNLYDNVWVIIQRRQEGAVSFYRSWVHYVEGFGNPLREFFIGLAKLYELTNSRKHELLIKLEDYKGKLIYARYDEFLIGNGSENFQLKKLGNYSGNAGDYLRDHVGMYFSTRDQDNDASHYLHCAKVFQGGWWYNNCMTSNLNGPFRMRYEFNNINITWGRNNESQFKIVQMMIRSSSN